MDDTDLYAIGDVSRRTGLSVSAIRFYADAGIIAPTCHSSSGYRLYDVHAIARLELVRTLRELGTNLDNIRRLLSDEMSLHDLAVTHLELVEGQLRRLHAGRAVLRAIVKQQSAKGQVNLMHKLVSMSDDDRNRLVEDFWNEVTADSAAHSTAVQLLRDRKPKLSEEPTTEQLEAWIELADLLRDPDFRNKMRRILRDASFDGPRRQESGSEPHQCAGALAALVREALEAQRAGAAVDSAQARSLAERLVALGFGSSGEASVPARMRREPTVADLNEPVAPDLRLGFDIGVLLGRYLSLVVRVNGTVPAGQESTRTDNQSAVEWLVAAVEAAHPHAVRPDVE